MAEREYAISLKEVEAEYQELAARMNYDGSKYLPRIFKKAFTLEQATVALGLYTPSEEIAGILGISKEEVEGDVQRHQIEAIAKKLNLDKETVDKHIRYMFELGYALPTRRGWRFARNQLQAKDSQTNPKFDEELGDEYFDLWEAFLKVEAYPTFWPHTFGLTDEFGPRYRIIPARKSLKNVPSIVPEDNLEEVIKLTATIAVEHCPCRRLVRDRACQSPTEVCLIFDRVAEHNLRRGAARVIDVEEALAIHDMASDLGMVCNAQSYEVKQSMICHCHWCCCDVLAPAIMMNYPIKQRIAPSCYQASVEPDKCEGCQTCLTRCQFGAIGMKQYPGAGRQDKLKAWVDPDKCMGCGLCVTTCPAQARSMKQVKEGESIPEESTSGGYYGEVQYKDGKHLETGSVMIRPLFPSDR